MVVRHGRLVVAWLLHMTITSPGNTFSFTYRCTVLSEVLTSSNNHHERTEEGVDGMLEGPSPVAGFASSLLVPWYLVTHHC